MTPNESHAHADHLAETITTYFLSRPSKLNVQQYIKAPVSEVINQIDWKGVPHELDNWTFDFSHTYRLAYNRHDPQRTSTELRGVMRIINHNNAEYKYEITDDFVERYFGWATIKS